MLRAAMRSPVKETPFPFPPLEGAETRFPEQPPWDVPINRMSNWWLRLTCECGDSHHRPLRLMSAELGWRLTLRQILPRLKCRTCGDRPSQVHLLDTPAGDTGRFGAKSQSLRLK
jgi:hypothetical protein